MTSEDPRTDYQLQVRTRARFDWNFDSSHRTYDDASIHLAKLSARFPEWDFRIVKMTTIKTVLHTAVDTSDSAWGSMP